MNPLKGTARGYTLIEIMIVVAIIGILAAVAMPKYADLVRKSNEGATKGNLGAIRSALSIYYGDMEGVFPGDPAVLAQNTKYMTAIPSAWPASYHATQGTIHLRSQAAGSNDAGGWLYYSDPTETHFGHVFVNCTHTDTQGIAWTSF